MAKDLERTIGSLLGFAIGDALGAPVEFEENSKTVTDFQPSYRKGLQAGQYTDDTQQLILALDSLIDSRGEINISELVHKLQVLYNSGEARSVGYTTSKAIKRLNEGIPPERSGGTSIRECGSLALSRLVPFSLYSALSSPKNKLTRAGTRKILGITHAHLKVLNMGELLNYYIQEMIHGKTAEQTTNQIIYENDFLNKRIRGKLEGVLKNLQDSDGSRTIIANIGSSGYVEDILFSSLYSVMSASDFEEAILRAVNGGGDTDTRAAITGALYGLQSGISGIPEKWVTQVEDSQALKEKAEKLYDLTI